MKGVVINYRDFRDFNLREFLEYKRIKEDKEWRPVVDYEGLYEVSNFGLVKSLDRYFEDNLGRTQFKKSKILKVKKNKDGYIKISLCKNGKHKTFYLHRLVYETFVGKIPEGMQVNHVNEDKTDNRLENLNLMTSKENVNWGTGIERRAKTQKNDHRSKSVLQLTLDGELIKEWSSTRECGRNGFNQGNVASCCRGDKHYKTYKGYIWKFKNES